MLTAIAEAFSVSVDCLFDKESIFTQELSKCIDADLQIDYETLKSHVNGFLETLSVRDRAVFIRRYYYFEDISEIGAEYGIRENYVRTILMRTRRKLKKYLKGVF